MAYVYAVLDQDGKVTDEISYDVPLAPEEIGKWPNGQVGRLPLVADSSEYDSRTHRMDGFSYEVFKHGVVKHFSITRLSKEELNTVQRENIRATRMNALPCQDEALDLLATVLLKVIDRLAMTEDPKDPRSMSSAMTKEELDGLRRIADICAANPLP